MTEMLAIRLGSRKCKRMFSTLTVWQLGLVLRKFPFFTIICSFNHRKTTVSGIMHIFTYASRFTCWAFRSIPTKASFILCSSSKFLLKKAD